MSGHTKEPWVFQRDYDYTLDEVSGYFVQGADGREIFYRDNDDRPETWGDLKRATDCVNAIAGLNPSALAGLIEAADRVCEAEANPDYYTIEDMLNGIGELRTALANLRGDA